MIRERASVLRYMYIVLLSFIIVYDTSRNGFLVTVEK
jgi:hypothetical protein